MTEGDLFENVTSYLTQVAWTRTDSGVGGELWTSANEGSKVGVPFQLTRRSQEFDGIIHRIAKPLKRPEPEVKRDILKQFEDTHEYKIDTDPKAPNDVPLRVASDLLSTAWRITRAAATTARGQRATIAGYSKIGDDYAGEARFEHTQRGSFILPVTIPVRPLRAEADHLEVPIDRLEPFERRLSRTIVSSLAAIDDLVVKARHAPRTDEVLELISRGVSRQMVNAVRAVLHPGSGTSLKTSFDWARALDGPGGLPTAVEIPSEADRLLANLEHELDNAKAQPHQEISGPILVVNDDPALPDGWISIRSVRRGREPAIVVYVDGDTLQNAHDWARDRRIVRVGGDIEWVPGRGYYVRKPTYVLPESELFGRSS